MESLCKHLFKITKPLGARQWEGDSLNLLWEDNELLLGRSQAEPHRV